MKKIRFEPETDGFHGVFCQTKVKSEAVMTAMRVSNAISEWRC